MKKSLWTPVLALALFAAPVALPVMAAPGGGEHAPGGPGMAEHHMNRMFDKLNLTADQKTKLQAIRTKSRDANKAQHEAMGKKWQELSQLMRSATATREQALAKQREINALQAQLAESRVATWFEMRAVLTADQLKQLETMKGEGRRGRRDWKHR